MVSSRWIHARLWCSSLPSYHLLSLEEAELEKRVSRLYFDSGRFADLRMQIRLKLKELPQSSRFDNPAVYWDILELFDEYLPLLLSVQRYHAARRSISTTLPFLLTTFSPLFYGFGELNLLTDRLVGQQHLAQFSVPVELLLVLSAIGQLHAMHAESQIMQGGETLTIASWPRMQHAEVSWQSSESFFRWATSFSCQAKEGLESADPLTRTIWRFFEAMAIHSATLARMCATHRLSAHITGFSLTEMRPERLSRLGSVCARRALTLLREANSAQSDLRESSLREQFRWCLSAYEIRWTALYYQCEQTVYRLDANPDIALNFCEGLLKLRMPHVPSTLPQHQGVGFSQFAHDLQLKHHAHLTDALDDKKKLLGACRGRFGTTWTLHALDKSLISELLTIRDMGPMFSEEQRAIDSGVEEEQSNYASPFLVEVIAANVEAAILQAKVDDLESGLANESEIIVTKKPRPTDRGPKCANNGLMECHTVTADARIDEQLVENSSRALNSGQPKKRPASAKPQGSGWVTMSYGGKLLHFEKSVDPPHVNQSKSELEASQRDFASAWGEHHDDTNCSILRQSKTRPSSSPCYLSSKKTAKPHDHGASSARSHPSDAKLWVPTRASCALCERRFMRSSLPGVVVMKRIYDLRRKWGIIQDSKKFRVPSALYGTANVCLLCQEILAFEEGKHPSKSTDGKTLSEQNPEESSPFVDRNSDTDPEVARMIHDSILYRWHQEPSARLDNNLQDIAVNKRVRQSSTVCGMKAQNALSSDTNSSAHTKEEFQPWWEIDLANYVEVHSVKVYLRDEVSHLYAAARGLAANPSRRTTGVYPLHISVSMKTGVGRDCDDIVASCVSSLCINEKTGPSIEWLVPHTSRGRFVRIQCEGRAVLHIERVHIYVTKPPKVVNDPVVRRQHVRQKLQRAAFCASVIATTATPLASSSRVAVDAEPSPKRRMSALAGRSSKRRGSQVAQSESQLASALFFDPERAEKRRVSRLYARFKGLLDARAKYVAPEEETDEEANEGGEEGANTTHETKA